MQNTFRISAAAVLVMTFASCSDNSEGRKPAPKAETTYHTMILRPRHIGGNVQLPGVFQPFEIVHLYPRVNGFVKNVLVDRGSAVKRGQVLIALEAPETEQQVAAAKLKYAQAEAIYLTSQDRYKRLLQTSHTPGTVSPYDLEAAAAKMRGDSATSRGEYANYEALVTTKGYLTVTAPFDGIITERNVHPGALAGPQNSKPMLVLQQLSKLRLVVDLPEQYAVQVKDGDKIRYKLNSLPGQDFTGEISRSSQSLSNSFRSETVEIDVLNTDNRFKPGMYAEVVLPTSGNTNAYVVPRSAVVTTTEKKYVIALDANNTSKWVDVSEGNQGNDSIEIFGPLKNGDKVVVNADYQLKEGQAIR